MLLSVVVLSYNRPFQIARILENFLGFEDSRVNLIIKDDKSPKLEEIKNIFNLYKGKLKINCTLFVNDKNLGYDLNLWSSFFIFDSEYIFLLSDDDYIKLDYFSTLLDLLSLKEHKVYFTPFSRNGTLGRINVGHYSLSKFSNVIYNSVLFSGLIFHSKSVREIPIGSKELENSIYSQVIISSILIYNSKTFGVSPAGILFVGGDGENFFGKNQSAVEVDKLSDRSSVVSNLNYQKFLLLAVLKLSEYTNSNIYNFFLKEYKIRLLGYMLKIRSLGIKIYLKFSLSFVKSHANKFIFHVLFLFIFFFFPAEFSKKLYNLGVKKLRNDD
jgi:hypothetical protein